MKIGRFFHKRVLLICFGLSILAIEWLSPSPVLASPPLQDKEDIEVQITNDSHYTVCAVYLDTAGQASSGENQLEAGEDIRPDTSVSILVPTGAYDIVMADCDDNIVFYTTNQRLTDNSTIHITGVDACQAINQVGMSYHYQGEYDSALERFEAGLTCYRDINDLTGEAETLNAIGTHYTYLGEYKLALETYQEALDIEKTNENPIAMGHTLGNLGGLYTYMGEQNKAIDSYKQALNIWRDTDNKAEEAMVLDNLGVLLATQGNYTEALDYHLEALPILQNLDAPKGEAHCLNNIGFIYDQWQRYTDALSYYQRAHDILQSQEDQANQAIVLSNIAGVQGHLGKTEKAINAYQQALAIHKATGNRSSTGITLNNIGFIYDQLGTTEQARTHYEQALEIFTSLDDQNHVAATLGNLGDSYAATNTYTEALSHYHRALTLYIDTGDPDGEASARNDLGLVYSELGQRQRALEHFQLALRIYQDLSDQSGIAESLSNLGGLHIIAGHYEDAIQYHQQALDIRRDLGDRIGEGNSLNNIGGVYDQLGDYEQALDLYQQALVCFEETGAHRQAAYTLNNIGFTWEKLGNHTAALEALQQTRDIWQTLGDDVRLSRCLNNIGGVYDSLKHYEDALAHYDQALTIQRAYEDKPGEGYTLNNIGFVYDMLNQPEQALNYYQQALTIFQDINDLPSLARVQSNMGSIYRELGRYSKAWTHYQQAITLTTELRGKMSIEDFKSSFTAEHAYAYQGIIPLLIHMERHREAFTYTQQAKARTFLEQLTTMPMDPRTGVDAALLTQEKALLAEIRRLEAEQASTEDLTNAYREYERLVHEIELSQITETETYTIEATNLIAIQQALEPEITLLEYYVASDQTLVFAVTHDTFRAIPISVTQKTLSENIRAFRQFPTLNDVPETSQTLYTILFEPVRAYIQTSAIYIAPHNILHYLPFGALHDGQHFLVENYTIAYTPSASVMAYLKSQRSTQDSMRGQEFQALVLGDPAYQTQELPALPYAKPEAESVAAILGTNVHLGADATEKLLVEEGQRANYIHIVAHGELNPSAPQFSRVCLASSTSEQKESSDQSTFSSLDALDGSLNVWEIWNLPLENVELVTLSACETQLGEVSAGDDIVGLNRAFLHAGVRSLIASLWKVEDQSTEFLMTRLYTYLNDGKGEAEALRLAQLDTLETYPSPYYWAPFTLVGDIGEIAETQPPLPWGWIGGGIVLVVLLGIARYLHKHH